MLADDAPPPPWGFLRGFAWFLLSWPLLCVIGMEGFGGQDWEVILGIVLVPPVLGVVLLGIDTLLTKTLGRAFEHAPRPVPNVFRDLSNVAFTLVVLGFVDLGLSLLFDREFVLDRHPERRQSALELVIAFSSLAVVLRLLGRLVHGPGRKEPYEEDGGDGHRILRFLGYLTLIPMLLVSTVMAHEAMSGDSEFDTVDQLAIIGFLFLGLRSAGLHPARGWARDQWEARLRFISVAFPWWALAWALGAMTAFVMCYAPFADDDWGLTGRIVAGVIMVPIGALVAFGVVMVLVSPGPQLLREVVALMRTWFRARLGR